MTETVVIELREADVINDGTVVITVNDGEVLQTLKLSLNGFKRLLRIAEQIDVPFIASDLPRV